MIKQDINLYLPEFRKTEALFTARTIAASLFSVCVLLALIQLFSAYRLSAMAVELRSLSERQQQIDMRLASLRTAVKPEVDPKLEKAITGTRETIEANKQVIRLLTQTNFEKSQGFSRKFEGLARRHQQGVWLTEIHFSSQGSLIELAGWTRRAEAIPQYLQSLVEDTEFEAVKFGVLRIERDVEQQGKSLRFNIGRPGAKPS